MKFALVLAADGASAGSRVAYFKVSLVAPQDVSWEQRTTSPTGDGGSPWTPTFTRLASRPKGL